jgi:hypothetical protein
MYNVTSQNVIYTYHVSIIHSARTLLIYKGNDSVRGGTAAVIATKAWDVCLFMSDLYYERYIQQTKQCDRVQNTN